MFSSIQSNSPLLGKAALAGLRGSFRDWKVLGAGTLLGAAAGAGIGYWRSGNEGAAYGAAAGSVAGAGAGILASSILGGRIAYRNLLAAELAARRRRDFENAHIFAGRMFMGRSVGGW